MMKPQDILVALKLAAHPGVPWRYAHLARELGLSVSETHASVQRNESAGILVPDTPGIVVRRTLVNFLVHGLRCVFPAEFTRVTRGVPTALSAPVLGDLELLAPEPALVWPAAQGTTRGQGLHPLYRTAPSAALVDPALYRLLALAELLRVGAARERAAAERALHAEVAP
ncbi:MAG: hypothetical protein HY909_14265 [Deltaproteobacteria bacterium]|nr:hypothetical protein [Deltaproteobacteria bacterium]